MKNMTTLKSLKEKVLADPEANEEYSKLEPEFKIIETLLTMRTKAGLTQLEVAQLMGTQESNISRLEKGTGNPTVKTLCNYAKACGFNLNLGFSSATCK